jgi:hypothetical protein
MKNLFHLVTAARSRRAFFFKLNGENISGDGIILSDMEFGIHTLSRSHPLPLKIQLYTLAAFSLFLGSADFRSVAHLCRNVAHRCYWWNS